MLAAAVQVVGELGYEKMMLVYEAAAGDRDWRSQLRASLAALLGFFAEEPLAGRVLVVDALKAGLVVLKRRADVVAELIEVVEGGGGQVRGGRALAPLTAEGVVGAVLAVVDARLSEPDSGSLTELFNQTEHQDHGHRLSQSEKEEAQDQEGEARPLKPRAPATAGERSWQPKLSLRSDGVRERDDSIGVVGSRRCSPGTPSKSASTERIGAVSISDGGRVAAFQYDPAFLIDRTGRWELAPAFDVTYAYRQGSEWKGHHQMTLNGKRDDFTLQDFDACGRVATLPQGRARRIVEEVGEVVSRWEAYAGEARVDEECVHGIAPALRLSLAAA